MQITGAGGSNMSGHPRFPRVNCDAVARAGCLQFAFLTGAKPMDRRRLLKNFGLATLGSLACGSAYPFLEAKWCKLTRWTIALPNLPSAFRGTTIALLADVHHGPFV